MEFALVKPPQVPPTPDEQKTWALGDEKYTLNLLRACWFLIPVEFVVGVIIGRMESSTLQVVVPGMVAVTFLKLLLITMMTFGLYLIFDNDAREGSKENDIKSAPWPWRRWLAISIVLWLLTYVIKLFSMILALALDSNEIYDRPCFFDVFLYLAQLHFPADDVRQFLDDNYRSSLVFFAATLFHSFLACLILLGMRRRWNEHDDTAAIVRIASLAIALTIVHWLVVESGAYAVTTIWR